LTLQGDALWSFVGSKDNRKWIWRAIDERRAQIVGLYVGARGRGGAAGLCASLPTVYRQCAVAYTDFWSAYEGIFPAGRHLAVGKETGGTSKIERFNNTMRQRSSRLVRKTLSFSKKLANHSGAMWRFVHHYNASLGLSSALSLLPMDYPMMISR
jgi:insertion element IS1 protein InsB